MQRGAQHAFRSSSQSRQPTARPRHVQPGSDDRRHRRLGTLLVIDDHFVSLVQGGSRFCCELLDLAGPIGPSSSSTG